MDEAEGDEESESGRAIRSSIRIGGGIRINSVFHLLIRT